MTPTRATNRTLIALSLALLAACTTPASGPPASGETIRLRVIGFNDFHGNLEPGQTLVLADPAKPGATMRVQTGGADAMAGLVKTLRAGAPYSLLISAGDMVGASPLVSTLFRHESTIEAMNRMAVSVGTTGNHEFDAGYDELRRLSRGGCATNAPGAPTTSCALHGYAGMGFPLVTANVAVASGREPLAPSWVTQVGPVKVGVIGAVTRTTKSLVTPSGVAGLDFGDEADAINRAAADLKAQGVNTMIVTIHEGGEPGGPTVDWNDEPCPGLHGPIVEIARRVTRDVDLIISGHTHQGYRCVIDGRVVVESYSYGRGLSATDLTIDVRTGHVDHAATRSRNLPILNDRTDPAQRAALAAAQPAPWGDVLRDARPDPDMARSVAAYGAAAAPRAAREVGQVGGPFDRGGKGDSKAGRLVADAQWAATRDPSRGGAQLALMNPGGIRADLPCRGTPPCTVTFGDAFTMQPFGNTLVVMTLSGAELKSLLESQRPPGRESTILLQPSSSLRYLWAANAPFGRRVQQLTVDGVAVRPDADYRVTVNSFLADGGDGFELLRTGRQRTGGMADLDALIAYLGTAPAPIPNSRIEWVD